MKKIIAFVLAAIMMLTLLAGCSNGNANTEKKKVLKTSKSVSFSFTTKTPPMTKTSSTLQKPLAQTLVFPKIRFL